MCCSAHSNFKKYKREILDLEIVSSLKLLLICIKLLKWQREIPVVVNGVIGMLLCTHLSCTVIVNFHVYRRTF